MSCHTHEDVHGDGKQMLYAEPLTTEQMQKLSQTYTSP